MVTALPACSLQGQQFSEDNKLNLHPLLPDMGIIFTKLWRLFNHQGKFSRHRQLSRQFHNYFLKQKQLVLANQHISIKHMRLHLLSNKHTSVAMLLNAFVFTANYSNHCVVVINKSPSTISSGQSSQLVRFKSLVQSISHTFQQCLLSRWLSGSWCQFSYRVHEDVCLFV